GIGPEVRGRLLAPGLGRRLEVELAPLDARAVVVAGGGERLGEAEARFTGAPAARVALEIRAILDGGLGVVPGQALRLAADEARFAIERALGWNSFGMIERLRCPSRLQVGARREQVVVIDEQGVLLDQRLEMLRSVVEAPRLELGVGHEEAGLLAV